MEKKEMSKAEAMEMKKALAGVSGLSDRALAGQLASESNADGYKEALQAEAEKRAAKKQGEAWKEKSSAHAPVE